MAKELPYFKFEPSAWENGNIQMCSFEAQGVFINICSMYWQRLGDLPYKLAVQKICKGNATALDSLIQDEIIRVIDGMICIDFLNEQLAEFENISSKNSDNARLGWEKRRSNATASPPHSERNAIREEKRIEEEIKVDKIILPFGSVDFLNAWNDWLEYKKQKKQKLTPKTIEKQLRKLGAKSEVVAIAIINQSIEQGWQGLFELKQQSNGNWINKKQSETLRTAAFVAETYSDILGKGANAGGG